MEKRSTGEIADQLLMLEVRDGDLEKLGTKFFKGRSRQSGSGLGLAICKEIIGLHGGRIRIESEFTVGTSVIVELPRYIME